jgi:hypothetical protein
LPAATVEKSDDVCKNLTHGGMLRRLAVAALVLLLAAALVDAKRAGKARGKPLPTCAQVCARVSDPALKMTAGLSTQAGKFYKANKLYEVLGLAREASDKDIKTAFKKMSLQCHPDKCEGPLLVKKMWGPNHCSCHAQRP